jgi:hypothetical protein
MGFVIPMMMALMLAVGAMSTLAIAALRESDLFAVFYEDRPEMPQR